MLRVAADGTQTEVSQASYDAAVRGRPRSLLLDDAEGRVLTTYIESGDQLRVDGSVLAGRSGQDLFDGVTGERLTLELPDGTWAPLCSWSSGWTTTGWSSSPGGTLRSATSWSAISAPSGAPWTIPAASSLQEALLFPGDGLVGGELALMEAMFE